MNKSKVNLKSYNVVSRPEFYAFSNGALDFLKLNPVYLLKMQVESGTRSVNSFIHFPVQNIRLTAKASAPLEIK
jgi:hypothetical protein